MFTEVFKFPTNSLAWGFVEELTIHNPLDYVEKVVRDGCRVTVTTTMPASKILIFADAYECLEREVIS